MSQPATPRLRSDNPGGAAGAILVYDITSYVHFCTGPLEVADKKATIIHRSIEVVDGLSRSGLATLGHCSGRQQVG